MTEKAEKFDLESMLERYERCLAHDSELRVKALDDVKFAFVEGSQWDADLKKKRKKRPCYEFNRLRQSIKQVVNEIRKNKPAIKVRAVDSGADRDTAETLSGLIRNIESVSNADTAYGTAATMAAAGGYGVWRVTTDYSDDSSFDQDIFIKEIRNPFCVRFDPAALDWDRRDGMFAFLEQRIARDEYKVRWPKAEVMDFKGASEAQSHWVNEDSVLIAEYWEKKPVTKTVCLLSTGETVDKTEVEPVLDELAMRGVTVQREREVKCYEIIQHIVSGVGELEPQTKWPGKFIPLVPVWGELISIEGRDVFSGMVRASKDSQKAYNFSRTTMMEAVANAPKAPYMLTPEQIKGFEPIWNESAAENYPYLLANPDPKVPGGMPERIPAPQVPAALMELSRLDADDIKATSGIYDASLGARSNETSGKAIIARRQEGDTANFDITDNLARGIKFTGDILVDLIPKIYDTQRIVRIIGEDGSEKSVTLYEEVIDEQTGLTVKLNDLTRGKFDVAVTVGPSFATSRMEAAEMGMAMLQSNKDPVLGLLLTRFMLKNTDSPYVSEIEEPIRKMLIAQGVIEPEEDTPPPAPQPPDPIQQMEMAGTAAKVELETHKAAREKYAADGQQLLNQKMELEIAALQQQLGRQPVDEGAGAQAVEFARLDSEERRHREKLAVERATALEIEQIKQASAAALSARQQQQRPQEPPKREPERPTDIALTGAIGALATVMREMNRPKKTTLMRGPDGKAIGSVSEPAD